MHTIPFNRPFITGKELTYIQEVFDSRRLSGNGRFTKQCEEFFETQYGFKKCLLTSSCTDALEMAALLLDIQPGDEVIMPSYTFVSTANAFVLRGAKIRFVDSRSDHPGIDESLIEELISPKTKLIVVVHYAGVACDMTRVMDLASRYGLWVVEDAAQAVDSFLVDNLGQNLPLGRFGHLSTFSFHETKNISSGEGGMLVINDDMFSKRAEIIWEKGTNRSAFHRGEIDKYGWVDLGSSFLPSEITAAMLWAQLEQLNLIQEKRKSIWQRYYVGLIGWAEKNGVRLPAIPPYAVTNGHLFYLVFPSLEMRSRQMKRLSLSGVMSVFHYQSLHSSVFYKEKHDGRQLPWSDLYSECLLRLPLFFEMRLEEVDYVLETITLADQV